MGKKDMGTVVKKDLAKVIKKERQADGKRGSHLLGRHFLPSFTSVHDPITYEQALEYLT